MLRRYPPSIWARRSAVAGALVWILLLFFSIGDSPETGLIQRLLLLGILFVVPLALSLAPRTTADESRLYRLAVCAQLVSGIASVASFMLEAGTPAALLVAPWFCLTVILALWGLARLTRPELRTAEEFSISAGLLYLPIAGFSMLVSRLGIQLAGFGDTIILLTAVHFHYAAFAAPILAGLSGRYLRTHQIYSRGFILAPIGIIGGVPFVAGGITFSPLLALLGALLMAVGLFALAVLVILLVAPRVAPLASRILLSVSAVSSAVAIVMACLYAYSIVAHTLIFDIPQMAMTHGVINAFGFVLCGLIAWSLQNRER